MLGDSATTTLSGEAASETAHRHDVVGSVSVSVSGTVAAEENSGEEDIRIGREEGERSFGGNRWPRQETLALLKIRSEMDVAFRDASVKGPLWEQVSRKLGELGYHRSAKKCKEKFENVYKYHKRTKDVRSGKPDSKTYKFFEQLEALDTHPPNSQPLPLPPPSFHSHPPKPAATITIPPQTTVISSHIPSTVPSTTPLPHLMNISFSQPNPTIHLQQPPAAVSASAAPPLSNPTNIISTPFQTNVPVMTTTTAAAAAATAVTFHNIEADLISNSTSSSSSTSSDEELEASRRRKRKRKWKDFFERLMREVIQKQEEMQRRFLEAIEKREHERVVREEAWRMQEMSKINKEREILAQERSMAAAKDAAITSFLQKITDGQHNNPSQQTRPPPPPPPPPSQQQIATPTPTQTPTPAPAPQPQPTPTPPQPVSTLQILVPQKVGNINNEMQIDHNGGESYSMSPAASSSRWPKVEVQALIQLRTNLEAKYQENGPKGPLWEEISSAMKKIGYNRNAKRCKEKWENINKYFKKVKESKKMRREDSKTCPYFDLLDAIHKEKINKVDNMIGSSRPLLLLQQQQQQQPLMVQPEQQWPPQQEITRPDSNEEMDRDDKDRDDDDDDDDDEEDDEDEEEEDEGGGNYEIVASKPASVSAAE